MSGKDPDDPAIGQSVLNSGTEGTTDSTLNGSKVCDETRSSATGNWDVLERLEEHPTQEKDAEDEATSQGEVNRCLSVVYDNHIVYPHQAEAKHFQYLLSTNIYDLILLL